MKKKKERPYFYKTKEERKDAIRRSKTCYMLSKIWYCEVSSLGYCLAGTTQHLKMVKHNKNLLNRSLELDHLEPEDESTEAHFNPIAYGIFSFFQL